MPQVSHDIGLNRDGRLSLITGALFLVVVELLDALQSGYVRATLLAVCMIFTVAALWRPRKISVSIIVQRWTLRLCALVSFAISAASLGSLHKSQVVVDAAIGSALFLLSLEVSGAEKWCTDLAGFFLDPTAFNASLGTNTRQAVTRRVAQVLILIAILLVPAVELGSGLIVPKSFDVASTSVQASRDVLVGVNPYSDPLDRTAGSFTSDRRFAGYKYMPLTAMAYLPFVVVFGDSGILVLNTLAFLAMVPLVGLMAGGASISTRIWLAAVLVATPDISQQSFGFRSNDLLAVVPICIAILI